MTKLKHHLSHVLVVEEWINLNAFTHMLVDMIQLHMNREKNQDTNLHSRYYINYETKFFRHYKLCKSFVVSN